MSRVRRDFIQAKDWTYMIEWLALGKSGYHDGDKGNYQEDANAV